MMPTKKSTELLICNCLKKLYDIYKFQFDKLFRSNDTERVRAVTKITAPCTHCQRRLAAKFQFVKQKKNPPYETIIGRFGFLFGHHAAKLVG